MARRTRFRCWWCKNIKLITKLHHEQKDCSPVRRCCEVCANDKDSHYRKIYPKGAPQEAAEIQRVRRNNEGA